MASVSLPVVAADDPIARAGAVARLRAMDPAGRADAARRAAVPFTYAGQAEEFERLYREIRPLRIYEGTTEIQKLIVGSSLVKQARESDES